MASDDALLAVAALLGVAAYVLSVDDVQAEEAPVAGDGVTGSTNGFAINNPLNIRYLTTNAFNGQIANHNGYGQYDTLSNGVRAAGKQLTSYYNGGQTTVAQIVNKWAPSTENDSGAYISDVAQRMGVDSNEPLSWPGDEVALIQAMAYHENGYNNMTDADVQTYIAS